MNRNKIKIEHITVKVFDWLESAYSCKIQLQEELQMVESIYLFIYLLIYSLTYLLTYGGNYNSKSPKLITHSFILCTVWSITGRS